MSQPAPPRVPPSWWDLPQFQTAQQQRNTAQGQASAAPAVTASGDTAGWILEQHYDILGKIGEGTYGVVYLATSKQDKKKLYAIKKFKTGRVCQLCQAAAFVLNHSARLMSDSPGSVPAADDRSATNSATF